MTATIQIFANNATTTLASSALSTDTSISVVSAAEFPNPTANEYFMATMESSGIVEIIRVTGVTGNTFTGCIRGQEGTTAQPYAAGSRIDNRITAGTLNTFVNNAQIIQDISSVDNLPTPALATSNYYLCHSNDIDGNPVVAVKSTSAEWGFTTHKVPLIMGTVLTGATTNITSTSISTLLSSSVPGSYVLQFTSGANSGLARAIISSSTNQAIWATPLPNTPTTGDAFTIYQSDLQVLQTVQNYAGGNNGGGLGRPVNVIFRASPTATTTSIISGTSMTVATATNGASQAIYNLSSYNVSLNIHGSAGIGGMDTGTYPGTAMVAIYLMYDPTTQAVGLLGQLATSATAPETYTGAYPPSGYTMSALVGVYAVNSTGFIGFNQVNRDITVPTVSVFSTSTNQSSYTSLSISSNVPLNAKTIKGSVYCYNSGVNAYAHIAGDSNGTGDAYIGGYTYGIGNFNGVPMITAQTLYYICNVSGQPFQIYLSGYTI